MFSTELFECHQRSKKALVASLAAMHAQGASTPQGQLSILGDARSRRSSA
jgi:transposase-like protein